MNSLIDEYREAIRAVYGAKVADNLDVEVKDGWYHVLFREKPEAGELPPTRYRKNQLHATIANLKARANQS